MDELLGLPPDEFMKAVVARYRRSGFGRSLLEYLGMTPDEYGEWFLTGHVASRVLRVWGRDDREAARTEAERWKAANLGTGVMTEQGLRDAIAYHRQVHRPYLFAPAPGPMSECGLPTCQAVMAELATLSGRQRWEAQEFERLADLVGSRYAEEWLSILRDHCIPGHDAVPVWDALHLIMDIWRIAEAERGQ